MQNDNRREIRFRPEGVLLRTYLRAAGVAPESIAKPLVGVVTVSSQIFGERPVTKELGDEGGVWPVIKLLRRSHLLDPASVKKRQTI